MKRLRHIISTAVWTLVALYTLVVAMANIPMVQSLIGTQAAKALGKRLNTEVRIGRVSVGFFNRFIIDDVSILDQQGKGMVRASRLSAKFDYTDLAKGQLTITSAQLFGLSANLYKANAKAKSNFQFVIDSLQSKDTTKNSLTIAINSLVIRHGKVVWNQLDMPRKQTFDINHLNFSDISSHIIIGAIGNDSLRLNIKKLSFKEASGIDVKSLSLKANADSREASINNLQLTLPNSHIVIPALKAEFIHNSTDLYSYSGYIDESKVLLSDLSPFLGRLKKINKDIVFKASFSGTQNSIDINNLSLAIPRDGSKPILTPAADCYLLCNGRLAFNQPELLWKVNINRLTLSNNAIKLVNDDVPVELTRLHSVSFKGSVEGYGSQSMNLRGQLLSDAGNASVNISKQSDNIRGHIQTEAFNLRQILDDDRFGILATDINMAGNINRKIINASGMIDRLDYKQYSYRGISIDGIYDDKCIKGKASIKDPSLAMSLNGSADFRSKTRNVNVDAVIDHIAPSQMRLSTGKLARAVYSGHINADIRGNDINTIQGNVYIHDFSMKSDDIDYFLDSLHIQAGQSERGHYVGFRGDFGWAVVYGRFNYVTLPQTFANIILNKLPSISNLAPVKYKRVDSGNFEVRAKIDRSDWAKAFLNIPLDIHDTLKMTAKVDGNRNIINASVNAADITYDNHHIKNIKAIVNSNSDSLYANVSLTNLRNEFVGTDVNLRADASNDKLQATLSIDNNAKKDRLRGSVNTYISLYKDNDGKTLAKLNLQKSQFSIGDTVFEIHPSTLVYKKKHLAVNRLAVTSGWQSIFVNGVASQSRSDSLTADLRNINVRYILNLLNFHSVEFSGALSGRATASQLFDKPVVNSTLQVADFKLMEGRLGTLYANASWNTQNEQIDINAVATDTIAGNSPRKRNTFVRGYVSPKLNYIDLDMTLQESRAEFLQTLCSSFLTDVDFSGNGNLRLWGDLKKINLTGDVVGHGFASITPLGTRYKLPHAAVHFKEREIEFDNDTIYDELGNIGIITGELHHKHLGSMTYDLNVEAHNLLAFNFDGTDGSSFYGRVFGTGTAAITGRAGEVDINVDIRPDKGSEVVYDITSPEVIGSQDFIHWVSRDSIVMEKNLLPGIKPQPQQPDVDIPTDIRLSLFIRTNPDATLRIITDKTSGDYITLNGSGNLRATYFNKGGMDIFGTYNVDHGIYKLTIQNIIKRQFVFSQGGTIVFGGDPYSALLNLKAVYPIASVSLTDLQVGRSFAANNIRVNCIMGISGTPSAPKVDFNLDFPSLSQDQQQMISSVINGEEEMNQQVLYLLAVGRFYSRGANNANTQSDSQTSLAMQSILSGELSQQINNVLSTMMKTNDWNFGANISTGDEGWNNAVYEGLLSGRLLNNRLLINGQFGYRDNANATQSFIGDFDVRYLIKRNGNFSVHVYNKANDRYFTRNSLNTQGIGFILKKDFSTLRDLLGFSKKTKK